MAASERLHQADDASVDESDAPASVPWEVRGGWHPDRLLAGYECLEIGLPNAETVAQEPPGSLRATLVRRNAPTSPRAVLYVHGWSDYFFQTHIADFYAELGVDFYAIDLRRYGRSLVEGQLAGFVSSLDEYYDELDAALALIRAEHASVSLYAHSTGGLVATLWANDRPGAIDALMLNSPWLEVQSFAGFRTVTKPVLATLSSANPVYVMPMSDSGFYHRALHVSEEGEWDYDRNLKGDPAFKVRVGWFNAVLAGHGRVAWGLDIDCPVVVMISKRHDFRRTWHDDLKKADIVLDVEKIASRVTSLGDNVTLIRVEDAVHDLFLSLKPARDVAFAELRRWLAGYLPAP